MVPSPRIITSRRFARFLAMLAGGALVLAVGASFAVWLPKPAPTEQSAVALSDPEGMDAATTSASVTDTPTQATSLAPESAAPAPPQAPAPASPSAPKSSTPASSPPARAPAAPPAPAPNTPASPPPGQTTNFYVTGYGQPDNDPPGPAIAYPGPAPRHAQTGGVGSFADPVTIAVGSGRGGMNLVPGTRIYIGTFAKYGVIEDLCAGCSGRWIDVYDGSGVSDSPAKVAACQNRHTGTFAVEINPPAGRPVNARPLYDKGVCTP